MTIYWPDTLPLPIQYGASTEIGKGNKISTDMDYGNKRRRKRFTNVPDYQSVTVSYNDDQLYSFLVFYRNILLDGIVSFYAYVISGVDVAQLRCTIDDDSIKIINETYNRNTISFVLEVYNPIILDAGASWLVITYGPYFVEHTFADPLQYQVNVHYPQIMVNY